MKKKIIIVGVVVLLIAAVIGVSYAAFSYSQTGAYENTITTGETFAVEVNVYGKQGDAIPSAVDTLLAKANDASITDYEAGNTGEMYVFSHEAGEQQVGWTEEELTDYRYIGAAPNNYVTFNDELWRIIGIFTVEDASGNKEQRMKIVKNESIGNYGRSSVNWAGDTLNTQLNSGDYWNTLSDAAKSQIATTKWYFGMTPAGNANNFYINERSTDVYPYSGSSANWTGNIGLIYASDYYYATSGGSNTSRDTCYNLNVSASSGTGNTSSGDWDLEEYSDCKNNNWLYKSTAMHTLSIYTAPYSTWIISATGSIHTDSYHNVNSGYTSAVYPTLYLNANTFVVSGTGTSSDPYKLLES